MAECSCYGSQPFVQGASPGGEWKFAQEPGLCYYYGKISGSNIWDQTLPPCGMYATRTEFYIAVGLILVINVLAVVYLKKSAKPTQSI